MNKVRIKHLVHNPVQKASDVTSSYIGLEHIESGTGRLTVGELPTNQAGDNVIHSPGDVLFGKLRPYLSKSYLAKDDGVGSGELLVLRPEQQLESRFLLYLTLSSRWVEWATASAYGTKMPRTSWEELAAYEAWAPPLDEQRRIADFLDAETARIDRLTQLTQLQVTAINERLVEYMRSMTTMGRNSHHVVHTSIPWMPVIGRSFDLLKIGQFFRAGSGTTPLSSDPGYYDGAYSWVSTGDLSDGLVGSTTNTVTRRALREYPILRLYDPGSLVIAMYGATIGRVGILDIYACVNQACCVLPETDKMDSWYTFYWFRAHRQEIMRLAAGGGQPNISQDLIRRLRVPAPAIEHQRHIAEDISDNERQLATQVELLNRRVDLLAERRRALITAAVTGQLDVTTARGVEVA